MNTQPVCLAEYPGQLEAKAVLVPALEAAKKGKALPHICLSGPPGVGKTTLAQIISRELGTRCVIVDARRLTSLKDFYELIIPLKDNDVFFVDEIHGLDKKLEELLYNALDTFGFNHVINGKNLWIELHKFVLVGATTRASGISAPMRTRFGIFAHLEHYDASTLATIATFKASRLGLNLDAEAALELGKRSRGTARTVEKLLDRAHDLVFPNHDVTKDVVMKACLNLGINDRGLDTLDRKFMEAMKHNFKNQPTGLATLAAVIGDSEDNLAGVVEPYLIRQGLVIRTPRGRMLTEEGLKLTA